MFSLCTHECLIGAKTKGPLDANCPNVTSHNSAESDNHLIDHEEICKQTKALFLQCPSITNNMNVEQLVLKTHPDPNIFKISLPVSEYTFLIKCWPTNSAHLYENEKAVYKHLGPLQGSIVPVYLGSFEHLFEKDLKYHILISSAGISLEEVEKPDLLQISPNAYILIEETVKKLHSRNVKHGDLGLRNIVFDKRNCGFFLIDFEFSEVVKRDALKQKNNEQQLTVQIRRLIERQFEHEISYTKDPYSKDEPVRMQMYA